MQTFENVYVCVWGGGFHVFYIRGANLKKIPMFGAKIRGVDPVSGEKLDSGSSPHTSLRTGLFFLHEYFFFGELS